MKNTLKYTLLLFCGCAVMMTAGCGKQPLDDIDTPQNVIEAQNPADTAPDTETLMAGIEPEVQITVETKTSYDSVKGKFIWSEGDQVALHYSDGNFHTCTIKADGTAGYKPVILPSTTVGKSRQCWAVYPATAAVPDHCSFSELQVNYPDSYDISDIVNGNGSFEESCCPMVANNDPAKPTLDFYHVGGLLRMNMTLLDKNSAFVRFTFDKDVTGIYAVADLGTLTGTTPAPTVTTQGSASNNVVTVTLNGGSGIGYRIYNEPIYINVPVPCGSYSNIKVEILDASENVQESATIPRLSFARHHGKRIAFIDFHDRELTSTYVPGKFSVSDTKSVYFASGNLRVDASVTPRIWAFEQNQYDDNIVSYVPNSYTFDRSHISYFGWGTGDDPEKISNSSNYNDYQIFTDWGRHFNDAGIGSDVLRDDKTWYTPSNDEIIYLVHGREEGKMNHLGSGKIYNPVKGMYVIGFYFLPDVWVKPTGCTFDSSLEYGYETNKYTAELSLNTDYPGGLWCDMEESGVVFLPATGDSDGHSGFYWSSSRIDNISVYQLLFCGTDVAVNSPAYPYEKGNRVRLVHD